MISSEDECETVLERVCEAAVEDGAAPACREVPRQVCRSLPVQRQQCKYKVGHLEYSIGNGQLSDVTCSAHEMGRYLANAIVSDES